VLDEGGVAEPNVTAKDDDLCAVCGKSEPPPNWVVYDGIGRWVHTGTEMECEAEFRARLDRGGVPDIPPPALAEPAARTNGASVTKEPWSPPTVEEIPWDALSTEVRVLVLGLPDAVAVGVAIPATADVPHQAEPRSAVNHYAPGGLMDYVGGVIEGQLHQLDEVWKAKREAEQHASAPDPVPASVSAPAAPPQPMFVIESSKEDAGSPPVSVTAPSSEADCAVCGGDLYRCFPRDCPLR
jgi:hypothetical protein